MGKTALAVVFIRKPPLLWRRFGLSRSAHRDGAEGRVDEIGPIIACARDQIVRLHGVEVVDTAANASAEVVGTVNIIGGLGDDVIDVVGDDAVTVVVDVGGVLADVAIVTLVNVTTARTAEGGEQDH